MHLVHEPFPRALDVGKQSVLLVFVCTSLCASFGHYIVTVHCGEITSSINSNNSHKIFTIWFYFLKTVSKANQCMKMKWLFLAKHAIDAQPLHAPHDLLVFLSLLQWFRFGRRSSWLTLVSRMICRTCWSWTCPSPTPRWPGGRGKPAHPLRPTRALCHRAKAPTGLSACPKRRAEHRVRALFVVVVVGSLSYCGFLNTNIRV